jgi:peptidoglycan/xylan/chitin deacetylase (PgdA/CDA1 family)
MKRILRGLAVAIILWSVILNATYTPSSIGFSQKIGASKYSASSFAENGTVSIAFDDSIQSQYDYAYPLLKARSMVGTFNVITSMLRDVSGDARALSVAELKEMQSYGCEIASHSETHPDFLYISDARIIKECTDSKQALQSYGFTVNNFVYPYGDTNAHVDSIVSQYYRSGRSSYVGPYVMNATTQFRVQGAAGEPGGLSKVQSIIDQVYATKGWAIIFFHNIVPNPNPSDLFSISVQSFTAFLDYLTLKGVKTVTVNHALDMGSRDVDITSVVPSAVQAVPGTIIDINVTARNEGAMTETFNITTYYNNNEIGTQTVTDLASGANRTLTFGWNTSAVPFGDYTIKAIASTIPVEDTADNTYIDGTVTIFGPPTASFTCYPLNPYINQPVLFNASSSKPNGGTITNYTWNFDDGNITSTSNAITSHTYALARNYNVTVTVTNTEGLKGSASELVTAEVAVADIFSVASNSTVSDLSFNSTSLKLSFTVSGPSGTTGLTNVTIAKTFVANVTNLKVFLDRNPLQYTTTETGDSWVVSFTYTHSTHYIMLALNPSRLALAGDLNNDGKVSIQDLVILSNAYGSKPGDANWNPNADIDNDGKVDLTDLTLLCINYGQHYP